MATAGKKLKSVIIVLALCASMRAQEEPSTAERTAPPVAGMMIQESEVSTEAAVPDTRPITGMLPLTLGSFGTERSFLLPSFRVAEIVDTNPGLGTQSDVLQANNLSGSLELHRVSRQQQLLIRYTGGGYIYPTESELNSTFQSADIQQVFQFRRLSLTLADDVSYTPESAFGFAGLGGIGGAIAPAESPNQSILSGHLKRLSNSFVMQTNFVINPRSSLTVAGNFGLLRFQGGLLQESNEGGGLVGYNYSVSPRDSIGASYRLSMTRFQAGTQGPNFDIHAWQLVYGRKVTGKLALELSGGPEMAVTRGSALGSTAYGWAAQESLRYRLREMDVVTSYSHTITAGAGVFPGAHTDQIQGEFDRRLSRTVNGSLILGYAHNSNLQPVSGPANSAFDTEFLSAGLQRPLGHTTAVFLNYTFQHQSTNVVACGLAVCGDLSRHLVIMGFDWHMRPLLIH